ncbi:PiggyBac transposable element-derived protein 4, partial [Stegodyphus mimosarum]
MASNACRKRSKYLTQDQIEEIVRNWSDLEFSDESSNDEVNESEHDTNSEISADENEDPCSPSTSDFFIGKNEFKWSIQEPNKAVRTRSHNIILQLPGLKSAARIGPKVDPEGAWNLLFDESILRIIVKWTNVKINEIRMKYSDSKRHELIDTDEIEIKAFLGLLLYSAVFKSNREDIDSLFATDGTGREIFRCVITKVRFLFLLYSLRFDNPETRKERMANDKTAAISEIFSRVIKNCQRTYSIGEYACIDEMLVKFRGRCKYKMYMPKKPAKYGIKIMCLCDARNNYLYNAYIYCGKDSDGEGLSEDEKQMKKPTQAVLRLVEPIKKTNRNITADNWFSSIELVKILKEKGLTFVGTLKRDRKEIPKEFQASKSRKMGSSLYGFTKDMTLISYVPKERKAVILISSMHHSCENDASSGKPEIIAMYNLTKGGVDEFDKKCSIYSTARRTRRWPMAIFFRILDICAINAFILFQSYPIAPKMKRKDFMISLANQLVQSHVKRRITSPFLPKELKLTIRRVFGINDHEGNTAIEDDKLDKKRTCYICPPSKKRKTAYKCIACKEPVCLQCSRKLCKENCITQGQNWYQQVSS